MEWSSHMCLSNPYKEHQQESSPVIINIQKCMPPYQKITKEKITEDKNVSPIAITTSSLTSTPFNT